MSTFEVSKNDRRIHIWEGCSPRYHLEIALPLIGDDGALKVRTKVDVFISGGLLSCARVTDRPLWEYAINPAELEIDPALQYLECGPGLGGFIQHWYQHSTQQSPPLVAIDIADFGRIRELLSYAIREGVALQANPWLTELRGRCELLLSDRVRLISLGLQEVQQRHPELRGLADIVVDNNGPVWYAHHEFKATGWGHGERFVEPWEHAKQVELNFLRPSGKYLSNHTSSEYSLLRGKTFGLN